MCECRGVVAGDVSAAVRCVEAVLVKKIKKKRKKNIPGARNEPRHCPHLWWSIVDPLLLCMDVWECDGECDVGDG